MWRFLQNLALALFLNLFGVQSGVGQVNTPVSNVFDPRVALTVNPRTRELVIYWNHSSLKKGDRIVVTDELVLGNRFDKYELDQEGVVESEQGSGESSGSGGYSLDKYLGIFPEPDETYNNTQFVNQKRSYFRFGNSPQKDVIYSMMLGEPSGWWKTNVKYDLRLTNLITVNSTCYAFWVHLINENGTILNRNCLSAHPRWMNDLRDKIGDIKIRNLFIPGTHDSGSYKLGFDPTSDNNLLNKYSITQDDDIRSQLLHGIRYIDLRIGYYRNQNEKFWVNHGFTKFQPLSQILSAVKEFVLETNEIVIIDFQEFPIGFGQGREVYQSLAHYIYENMKQVLVPPTGSWDVSLNDVWKTTYNVIIGFDKPGIQFEFRDFLWESVEHRWPDVQNVSSLIRYLRKSRDHSSLNYRLRPVAEMAELTPKALGVLTDLYGGLRKMAEGSNNQISELYSSEFGLDANVVAVDFHLSTTIVDTAIKINSLKRSGR